MAEKTIRSHRERVRHANYIIKEDAFFRRMRISIFDREAFVEFFLLEDLLRHYKIIYDDISSKRKETREGKFHQEKQLEKIRYAIYMLKKCIEIMQDKLSSGAFSEVWKAIREHQLMVAAGKLKYLDNLVKLIEEMLKEVDAEALEAARKKLAANEFMDDLENHDKNVRSYYGLESESTINEIVKPMDDDVKEDSKESKGTINKN